MQREYRSPQSEYFPTSLGGSIKPCPSSVHSGQGRANSTVRTDCTSQAIFAPVEPLLYRSPLVATSTCRLIFDGDARLLLQAQTRLFLPVLGVASKGPRHRLRLGMWGRTH